MHAATCIECIGDGLILKRQLNTCVPSSIKQTDSIGETQRYLQRSGVATEQ